MRSEFIARKRPAATLPRIVRAPSRDEIVETQGLVHTMGVYNTGISSEEKKKKSSKCQAGFSWKPLRAPSNRFPLMKHIEFLQLYREDAVVAVARGAAARGAAADSGVTAQSSGLSARGGLGGGGPPLVSVH